MAEQQGIRPDDELPPDDLDDEPAGGGEPVVVEGDPAAGVETAPEAGDVTLVTAEDPERAAIRERRRQEKEERKRRQREAIASRNRQIQQQERQIQELTARVAQLADRTTNSDLARVDAAINTAATEIEYNAEAIKESAKAGDWEAFARANDALYTARRKQEELVAFKRSVAQNQSQAAQRPQGGTAPPDPVMVANAQAWMAKNKWFDPRLTDDDSRITRVIDEGLAREGFDPRTPEYWDELTERVRDRLPKRFAAGGNARDGGQRQITGSGTGRESPGGNGRIVINKERIDAMREAGIDWDDPKVRARMIKRFQSTDAEQRA